MGWVIIILICFSVLKNFIIVIYFGFIKARLQLRQLFNAEDEDVDSKHTSDNSSDTVESINSDEVQTLYPIRPDHELLAEI